MSRYIDADKLFEEVGGIKPENKEHYKRIGEFMNLITYTPTADVRENIKGEWIECEGEYRCSNCNRQTNVVYGDVKLLTRYCPNCGAQMNVTGGEA